MTMIKNFIIHLFCFCFFLSESSIQADQFESRKAHHKEDPKLLVLIIASDNHPAYLELQEIWRSYMHHDPEHVEVYFMKGDPNQDVDAEIIGDTIYTKVMDCYKPGITEKTLASMEHFIPRLHEFDYVLRTNLSSFYHFPRLLKYMQKLPSTKCYAGWKLIPARDDVTQEYYGIPFGCGAGFILSPDLVEQLVEGKEEVLKDSAAIPDDVVIGAFYHRRNIQLIPTKIAVFSSYSDWKRKEPSLSTKHFHFRAKRTAGKREDDDDFEDEIKILKELLIKFYP